MDDREYPFEFFISRAGVAGDIAVEVASALEGAGYRVKAQDLDFAHGGDFVGDIHEALIQARHLFILHTEAYDSAYWTRREFTSFLAAVAAGDGSRRICVLRCDESVPRGLLANVAFGDLAGVQDPEKRRQIILDVARGETRRKRRDPPFFGGSMPAPNPSFVGRADLLARIKNYFDQAESVAQLRIVALVGLGGVGKSAAARALVDQIASDYVGVWWLAAETRVSLLSGLVGLAHRLDPQTAAESDVDKVAQRALRRIEGSERPYLLILDNLDDQSLLELATPSRGAHIVLTSRRSDWFGRAHELRLDVMSPEDAAALLQARAGRRDQAGARRLAGAVGFLPLALDHAGAYAKLTMMSFDAYASRADELIAKAPKSSTHPMSLSATFALAIDNASREAPAAEACMRLFAVTAPDAIPASICDDAIEEDARFDALAALIGVSLIHPQEGAEEPCVSVHRLVQAVMRARMAADGGLAAAIGQALAKLRALFPESSYENVGSWPVCARLAPHALALRDHAAAAGVRSEDFVGLCSALAEYLHARGSYAAAADLYRDAREAAAARGGASGEWVRLSTKLGNALRSLGRREEAAALLQEAVGSPRADPADKPAIMTSLAELMQESGRCAEAERLLREAIAADEARRGRDHPDVALRLNNLARVRQEQGDMVEAELLFRESIAAGEARLGASHPLVGERLNNLAKLLQDLGRATEAERLYRESIANGEAALAPGDPKLAIRRHNLANLLRDAGDLDEADALYRAALPPMIEALPAEHPSLARVKYNFAESLAARGSWDDALALAEEAAAIHGKALGSAHLWSRQSRALVERLREAGAASGPQR